MRAGETLEEASANADAANERRSPGGSPGPGQQVGRLTADGEPVGLLWIGPSGDDPTRWWVWNVEIEPAKRGLGCGRGTMRMAEDIVSSQGAVGLGLNVFAHNSVARRLSVPLGSSETSARVRKDLGPGR